MHHHIHASMFDQAKPTVVDLKSKCDPKFNVANVFPCLTGNKGKFPANVVSKCIR